MDFTEEQFVALLDDMTAGMDRCRQALEEIPILAEKTSAQWYVPAAVADRIRWLARETVHLGRELADVIKELLDGAVAPIQFLHSAWDWREIRGGATGVGAALSDQNLSVDDSDWSGSARDAYQTVVVAQSRAATQLAVVADGTANCLSECVVAAVAFYVSLAVVLAKLVAAVLAAAAAFGSAVLCWAGAALIVEEAGLDAATISAALAALAICLTAQAKNMVALHGLAVDRTSFPNGAWPAPNTGTYADATVTDGDADWSLRG